MIWLTERPKPRSAAERTRAYRQRVLADTAVQEQRRREYLERQRGAHDAEKIHVPVVKVLVPWHVDPSGCIARTVGCESATA